jgi:hypothetical protein
MLTWSVFRIFDDIGCEIPKPFPAELDIKGGYSKWLDDAESGEERGELLFEENPHSAFIKELFKRFADINAFYMKYMFGHICDLPAGFDGPIENIDSCLIELAAANMEPEEKFAPKFRTFKRRTRDNYEEWIDEFKKAMFTAGMPLEAEYMDLVKLSSDFLSSVWETDKLDILLGEADERIHPDIYINEILLTLRRIDSVLPLILSKLEISQEEIEK